ncbi:MAG TPA: hypothetical protein VE978_00785 [Chitinophagales bacterium]|nr:hypothetical protein [Chitinophagales bacterium]
MKSWSCILTLVLAFIISSSPHSVKAQFDLPDRDMIKANKVKSITWYSHGVKSNNPEACNRSGKMEYDEYDSAGRPILGEQFDSAGNIWSTVREAYDSMGNEFTCNLD